MPPRRPRTKAHALAAVWVTLLVAEDLTPVYAQEAGDAPTISFSADRVRLDGPSQSLDVSGRVRVDEPPFHLSSDDLRIRRIPIGARLEGQGRVAFCPCLGTPLAVRFSAATVAPPHDLILQNPVLEVFGVSLAWLPAVWLRSSGRVGLLPPDLEWRGPDGFFAGAGLHLPWRDGDTYQGISMRAGAYVDGGAAFETALLTRATSTRVRWDRFRADDGVSVDARGALATGSSGPGSVNWRLSALREARSVRAVTDVEAAAQPFDRGNAEAAWRTGEWTVASSVRTAMVRGGRLFDLGFGGPWLTARRSAAIGDWGAYDGLVEAGQAAGAGLGAVSFARGETGALAATRAGPFGVSLAVRGVAAVASNSARQSAGAAGQLRAQLALPLARTYASGEARDPWVHRTEPRLEVGAVASHDGAGLVPMGRGALFPDDGAAWVVSALWDNRLQRWSSRTAMDAEAAVGAAGDANRATPLLRARVSVDGPVGALSADVARVLSHSEVGGAWVGRARLGSTSALHILTHVAERDGLDPRLARMLVDPTLEPSSGFLLSPGWTGGALAGLPLGPRVSIRGGADFDMDARALVAAVGAIELRDPCECSVVRLSASHRMGRGGVDVWVSLDLARAGR